MSSKCIDTVLIDFTQPDLISNVYEEEPSQIPGMRFYSGTNIIDRKRDERIIENSAKFIIRDESGDEILELPSYMRHNLIRYFNNFQLEFQTENIDCSHFAHYVCGIPYDQDNMLARWNSYTFYENTILKPGDVTIIGYFDCQINAPRLTHWAVYIGEVKNQKYYISKLGFKGDVCIATTRQLSDCFAGYTLYVLNPKE